MASLNVNRIVCLLLLVLVEWTVPQNGRFYYYFLILYVAQPHCLGIFPGDSQNSYMRQVLTDVYTCFCYERRRYVFMFCNSCYSVMKRQQCISPRVPSFYQDAPLPHPTPTLPSKPLTLPKEMKTKTTRFVIYITCIMCFLKTSLLWRK